MVDDIDDGMIPQTPGLDSDETVLESDELDNLEETPGSLEEQVNKLLEEDTVESDKPPVPYKRFAFKTKQVEELQTRTQELEAELKALKDGQDDAEDPLQHYEDDPNIQGNSIERSRSDKSLVDAIARAMKKDARVEPLVKQILDIGGDDDTSANRGGHKPVNTKTNTKKTDSPKDVAADERVTEMVADSVRARTEPIIKEWSPTVRKVVLREIAAHVDLSKKVSDTEIARAIKAIKEEFGFSKEDIYSAKVEGKKPKEKPALKPAAKADKPKETAEDRPRGREKPREIDLEKKLNARMRQLVEEAEGSDN